MSDIRVHAETEEAYRIIGGRAAAGIVLLCDHASNALPDSHGSLGLPAAELQRHIAYDIGAEAITELLAADLGAPAVLTRHSRLLIDPNRGDDDPTLIMQLSDGAVVPGNKGLSEAERTARIERYWRPYHDAVRRVIDACCAAGREPMIFSVHSMTHAWKGVARPWHVALLSGPDRRLADVLIAGFSADGRWVVGDNEPYRGTLEGDTLDQHAMPRGLPNVVIEYRQDLVANREGQEQWAAATSALLKPLLAKPFAAVPPSAHAAVIQAAEKVTQ